MAWIELLNQISIFVAVWVAVYGIDSWRREHTGKRQIELAEDSLALFYEASDAIKHLRHPLSFTSEIESIERGKYENDQEFKARENASVVFKVTTFIKNFSINCMQCVIDLWRNLARTRQFHLMT